MHFFIKNVKINFQKNSWNVRNARRIKTQKFCASANWETDFNAIRRTEYIIHGASSHKPQRQLRQPSATARLLVQ